MSRSVYYYGSGMRLRGPEGAVVRRYRLERIKRVVARSFPVFLLGVLLQWAGSGCSGSTAKYPELPADNGVVTVDLPDHGTTGGRFYTYRSGTGKRVNLFIYRESSGVAHAVLDACRTCYRWKKGYVLDGSEVVCLKCDMRFKLEGLAQGTGSCVPIALSSEQRGDTLIIRVAELEAGARFF